MKINAKVFHKLVPLLLIVVVRHVASIQKFTIFLQYFKKEAMSEIDFWADKHQSSLQIDTFLFDRFSYACLRYPGKFSVK